MDATQLVSATITALPALCTTTLLAASGVMTMGPGGIPVSLTQPAVYQVPCPTPGIFARDDSSSLGVSDSSLTQHDSDEDGPKFSDFRDPFYASTFPICYALAATTVTAYMLVIMLFVTPRSFLDGGIVYLGRRGGFTNRPAGGVSIGGRPWLQKIAALTVAISLTVATADTFKAAQNQYTWGIQNAKQLQDEVMGSVELKVIRIVSDTFLWLAQAQTLIRLFPRQREKIIIKWVAFALITLDVIFSALNSFKYSDNGINTNTQPKNFVHPVPALSYLFQLSLGLLYAAWVIYYALMKKRYAFYHPLMKNICLVAIISVTSVVIPVVFFILDISKPDFTGWGDYVRWVGAAAASVVVWEWVERIEALEREEKKDGILGREVFDGDDMLEVNAAEFPWMRNSKSRKGDGPDDGNAAERQQGFSSANGWPNVSAITHRYRGNGAEAENGNSQTAQRTMGDILRPPIWPTRPPPAVTPVSRTDTASAASTVYAVRYQPPSESTARTPDPMPYSSSAADLSRQTSLPQSHQTNDDTTSTHQAPTSLVGGQNAAPAVPNSGDLETNSSPQSQTQARTPTQSQGGWRSLTYAGSPLFRRSSEDLPQQELPQPVQNRSQQASSRRIRDETGRWDLRARLELFAANQAERIRDRIRATPDTASLPVTVIPAPPRRGAALQQVLEEEELNSADQTPSGEAGPNSHSNSNISTSREASDEITQLGRSRSADASQGGEPPLPPNNPPLWRGVQSRLIYEDDYSYDDGYDDDEGSLSGSSSSDGRHGPATSGPSTSQRT